MEVEMKFVHIADLHLGKMMHQYSLLDIQKQLLKDLLIFMNEQNIHILVIAGDVYDRSIPSSEAVNVLDEFLSEAIITYKIKVLMISGNHDSHDRLNFASSLLKNQGLYIETKVHEQLKPIIIDDVSFYLLPFFKPSQIRKLYDDDNISTYQQAYEEYFKHQTLTGNKKVLLAHAFVGKNSLISQSEIALSVGGSEIIDASLFDDFDYVALGHLHASQKVKRETMRYSGSLMKYSFDEVKQNKSIVIVDTDDFSLTFHELTPYRDLKVYEGYYEDFMKEDYIEKKDDLICINLLDKKIIPHCIDHLRVLYPHILQLSYPHLLRDNQMKIKDSQDIEKMNVLDLYQQFYHFITDDNVDEESIKIISGIIERNNDETDIT
jgi:exonuclease SbcD